MKTIRPMGYNLPIGMQECTRETLPLTHPYALELTCHHAKGVRLLKGELSMSAANMVSIGGSTANLFRDSTLPSRYRMSALSIKSCVNGALPSNPSENYPGKSPKSTINKLESLLYPDKVVAEEKIERPVGLPAVGRAILNKPKCNDCQTKGLVVCATCTGSGLYIDSIMESQGIIVKVRCLGCGGSGNILCYTCGGRGNL